MEDGNAADDEAADDDDDDEEDGGKEVFASSCYASTFFLTLLRRKFNILRPTSFHSRYWKNKIDKIRLSKFKLKYRLTPR